MELWENAWTANFPSRIYPIRVSKTPVTRKISKGIGSYKRNWGSTQSDGTRRSTSITQSRTICVVSKAPPADSASRNPVPSGENAFAISVNSVRTKTRGSSFPSSDSVQMSAVSESQTFGAVASDVVPDVCFKDERDTRSVRGNPRAVV